MIISYNTPKKESAAALIAAFDRIEDDGEALVAQGVSREEIDTLLNAIETRIEQKIDGALSVMRQYTDMSDSIDAEIERLRTLKKRYDTRTESIRDYMKYVMSEKGVKKIETPEHAITYSRTENGAVDVFDVNALPDSCKRTKIDISPDKVAIKKAIEAGETINGARMIPSERLVIK